MFGLLALILGAVAIGCLFYAVVLTFRWLKNKIKEKLAARRARKVAVADLEKVIDECDNTVTIGQLEELTDKGYTHLMATVDNNNKVSDVEVIQDTSDTIDEDVYDLINRKNSGMVVVTA